MRRLGSPGTLATLTASTCIIEFSYRWCSNKNHMAKEQEQYFGALSTGMRISAYGHTSVEPLAIGKVTSRIADNVFVVTFDEVPRSTLVIELGSKVSAIPSNDKGADKSKRKNKRTPDGADDDDRNAEDAEKDALKASGEEPLPDSKPGLIAKVHGDDSYAILFDDDKYEARIPRDRIVTSEGRPKFMTTERFKSVQDWVGKAGVDKRSDREATAAILFQRGWRKEKLYLLDHTDVHCLTHLNKSVRMGILEKADHQRDGHRLEREILKERLKEKKDWRYMLTRYTGVFSAMIGVCGACSVFVWNYKRWRRETREFAVEQAANTLLDRRKLKAKTWGNVLVQRDAELKKLKGVLQSMDPAHPTIVTVSGVKGSGKTVLARQAANELDRPVLFVNVRGKEDPLSAVVKAMQVTNIARCGDLLEFVGDVCQIVKNTCEESGWGWRRGSSDEADRQLSGSPRITRSQALPIIFFKLQDTRLSDVHAVAIALACDRRVCHVAIEIDAADVDFETALKPRFDFYHVDEFTPAEALEYTEHQVDPQLLESYIHHIGTNSNALDELIAAVNRDKTGGEKDRIMRGQQYIHRRMSRACREIRPKLQQGGKGAKLLEDVAAHNFEDGLPSGPWNKAGVEAAGLDRYLHYNHESSRWVFHSKEYYSAVLALQGSPALGQRQARTVVDALPWWRRWRVVESTA